MRVLVVALLTTAFLVHLVQGILLCQNGATFDDVYYECICTAYYHGRLCEVSFLAWDPCANWSSVSVLRDRNAVHRLGEGKLCEDSKVNQCIDFSAIEDGWYRVVSPAGNYLITQCPTGESDCGSQTPYLLTGEVAEDNANRILSRARATRYSPNLSSGCYSPEDPSYPVRILKCSAALTLYYLQSLPDIKKHYCIGDKMLCSGGQTSIDGTGFEPCIGTECLPRLMDNPIAPVLRLDYKRQPNDTYSASFYCNVFPVFETNGTDSDGVRYLIEFELTYRNGTSVTIPRCRWTDEAINAGHNKIFRCLSEEILTRRSNLYGGSLVCLAQARCNTSGSQFNSVRIPSNSHGFFFSHWFENGTDVIKPGESVSLCISSKNIPVLQEVTFYISVGRQKLIPNDRTDIVVVRRDGNESLSCGFKMMNRIYREKQICQEMILCNHDSENRVTLGLERAKQTIVIKVNISFESRADGIYTASSNGSSFLQRIQNIDLNVDLPMMGMCYTDMTYNATVVRGNSTQMELLQENICPANCSGRGSCMNGECNCDAGFWGTSCELEIAQRDQMPVEISLLQRHVFCSSDTCSAAYLLVKPFLKSADSACKIQMNSRFNYTVPSVPVSGDIVMCELKEQHEWLINEAKMYSTLQIAVTAGTWESNNTVSLLLHQAKCQGRPVMCNEAAMTCQVGSRQGGDSGGGGGRCPRSADSAADDLNICLPSSGSTTQAPTLWIASPVAILLMELMSK